MELFVKDLKDIIINGIGVDQKNSDENCNLMYRFFNLENPQISFTCFDKINSETGISKTKAQVTITIDNCDVETYLY